MEENPTKENIVSRREDTGGKATFSELFPSLAALSIFRGCRSSSTSFGILSPSYMSFGTIISQNFLSISKDHASGSEKLSQRAV
ncbi:hypothetical protein N7447_009539 [Penicillium robsamsonii]|uniref:uncharacterized protein n=1 Tax=Penicillium robsamsonii TaxID=1792511 RepID=UPI002548BAD5|nr:uncharacterized protein N7447_009539 [Penicillium robsamsonii]KAJ5817306.1 hypothetical protein N7447_009539 [Penicillium robsamsonii]